MNHIRNRNLKALAKKIEADPFDQAGDELAGRLANWQQWQTEGCIDCQTLYEIAKEKSKRRAEKTKENSPEVVERLTRYAFSETDEFTRISLLCCLRGVQVPTASCILAWIFPELWGVIDRRAWSVLHRHNLVGAPETGVGLQPRHWVEYNAVIQELSRQSGQTPRLVDVWLYEHDKYHGSGGDRRRRPDS